MELRAFAEQVLFGTTLEEKLSFPREAIADTHPGGAIKTPRELPRPKALQLKDDGVRVAHPSVHKLGDAKERGRLLHFFCNHELLATELMALVLLKFPDAPSSFRQGVLETLKEEQIHTQLYLSRMKECGVEFGELPLNGYFWKSIAPMNDPLDYVTRLSLTFEQANLDYSREYARAFEEAGDRQTATILDKIYRDEIDHVGFGLKWFRTWKAQGKSDWEAFRERLPFPLSPGRAKGSSFNAEGRRSAGLDESFIQELSIFTQSKGRTPGVFYFNPSAELFVGGEAAGGYAEDAVAVAMRCDLATLPFYLCRQDDVVVMPQKPSLSFLSGLKAKGFALPEIQVVQAEDGQVLKAALNRKLGTVSPWAWSPDSVAFLQPLFAQLTQPTGAAEVWNKERKKLYAKSWSAQWSRESLCSQLSSEWLAPASCYGRVAETLKQVDELIVDYHKCGYTDIVFKAVYGIAGRQQLRLRQGESLTERSRRWIAQWIEQQGAVVVEPWLDRVLDFSIQFERNPSGLRMLGITRMLNNRRGQFNGIITQGMSKALSKELLCFIHGDQRTSPHLQQFYQNDFLPLFERALAEQDYRGPIGVDAFIYRNAEGELKLKPVVEINPRYTMGRVALELQRHNAPGRSGVFQVFSLQQLQKQGVESFADYEKALKKSHPMVLDATRGKFIESGSLLLNDPTQADKFIAVYHVSQQLEKIPGLADLLSF